MLHRCNHKQILEPRPQQLHLQIIKLYYPHANAHANLIWCTDKVIATTNKRTYTSIIYTNKLTSDMGIDGVKLV